jgi:hypothetical protein
MNIDASIIPDRIKEQVIVNRDLFGNNFISDLRPSAGGSAAKSGKLFENVVYSVLTEHTAYQIGKKPKFNCHFGLNREGDFEIIMSNRKIHLECKQLGNAESHFDKLSHCLLNVISGCYGKEFWLVYDYNGQLSGAAKYKIECLISRCKEIKKQVALQGITFELILIDDLPAIMKTLI